MRRLTDLYRDDHGVATIFMILAILALLVGAAFATDVGRYVLEARSAQNSADATVLAVATDCVATAPTPIADYSTVPQGRPVDQHARRAAPARTHHHRDHADHRRSRS